MLLAQRYPDDFDGIIAGAPAAAIGALAGVYQTWLTRTNTAADGSPILTAAKLPVLHDAVLAACDGLDGLVDGQLDDPRACRFDPAALRCPAGADQPDCLTAGAGRRRPQALRRARPTRAGGGSTRAGSPTAPSWPGTAGSCRSPSSAPSPALLGDNYLRYVGLSHRHAALVGGGLPFTARDFHRLTPEGVQGNALSLDLRRFRASGGKLILWHGWADQAIPPVGTLDYYQRLWQRDGGLRADPAVRAGLHGPDHVPLRGRRAAGRVRPVPRAGPLGGAR